MRTLDPVRKFRTVRTGPALPDWSGATGTSKQYKQTNNGPRKQAAHPRLREGPALRL